jgi:hypothetical protein
MTKNMQNSVMQTRTIPMGQCPSMRLENKKITANVIKMTAPMSPKVSMFNPRLG